MKKIIVISLVIVAIGVLFISPFFIKVKLDCKSQFGDCPAQILSDLSKIKNESLYKSKQDVSKTLRNNDLLTDFSTQFKLPDILVVNILVRKPEFALINKNTSELWLVDGAGIVLAKTAATALPKVVTSLDIPKSGQKVDDQSFAALRIIEGVWNMYQVDTGEITDGSLVVDLPGKINVIFPLEADPQVTLGALRLIYTKITTGENAGKYSQIDLRFKNPVLR